MHFSFIKNCCLSIIFGLCLGLSAPGIGLWLTAWFCLAPLLFIVRAERSLPRSFLYGFLFGLAFNCVYLQWYLGLAPLDWLGFNAWQGQLLAGSALLITACHQAFLIAVFSLLYRLLLNLWEHLSQLAQTSNVKESASNRQSVFWQSLFSSNIGSGGFGNWLQIMFVPLLWILITNKFGNAHDLTGVPWSMLEYTQYKQLAFIQIADIIGGIGICFLIVMINTLIAQIAYTIIAPRQNEKTFMHMRFNREFDFKGALQIHLPALSVCALLITGVFVYGNHKLAVGEAGPNNLVSIVQPNINIEMEKTKKRYSLEELLVYQLSLCKTCPPGLCVWTESSLPLRISESTNIQNILKYAACKKKISLIVGTIDQNDNHDIYNAAWAVSATGQISKRVYHKRYLVPFGEYTPAFVRNFPAWILCLTNTPAGSGYSSGQDTALLDIDGKLIAPLICFEVISPELAAASVRAGGQLLVNMNDLAWFHQSIIGEQMIACAVLRAVENRRDLIFAANTGPSAFISSLGKIKSYIGQNKAGNLIGKINYASKLSFFSKWFVF